ncbi:MAG: PKD domain-containing protein [Saprospiraceae bacterium]|nr:PKD domain-containing protein [Saprospiraceae bacterium]MDW8482950.1 PKD domain-containing protein [Saprospiraceae bacterium]
MIVSFYQLLLAFSTLAFPEDSLTQNSLITIQGPTAVCPGCYKYYVVKVIDAPGPTTATYKWTQARNDGTILAVSNDSTPTFCFQQSGLYKISVALYSWNGSLLSSASLEVRVSPYVDVGIVSSNASLCAFPDDAKTSDIKRCDRVCPQSMVTYFIEKLPAIIPPSDISWSVLGAADSFRIQEPDRRAVTVYWGTSGAGLVSVGTLYSVSPTCFGQASMCVNIVEKPHAAFVTEPQPTSGSDTVRICKGQTIWFDNRSQDAERYEWFFSDDLSTDQSIHTQHTFHLPGRHLVRLIATSGCQCSDTAQIVVEVLDAEGPTLQCLGDLCAGTITTYRVSPNCSGVRWSISPNGSILGGGSPGADSIVVRWNAGPIGTLWLTPQTCTGATCPFPSAVRIPIIDDQAQIQGKERVCPNAEEVYSIEAFGGTDFVWMLSGGGAIVEGQGTSRVTIRWSSTSNPNVVHRLAVRYYNCYLKCGGSDTIEVRILSSFFLNGPPEACAGSSASFTTRLTTTNQNLLSHWTLLGPNGSAVWSSPLATATVLAPLNAGPGYYRMRAIPANPDQTCTEMREWSVYVPDPPSAPTGIKGPAVICPGQTLTYTAEGVPADATVRWTVQNGPGAPQALLGNPINITWQLNGPYQLSAQVLSDEGLSCPSANALLSLKTLSDVSISGRDTLCVGETATYELPSPPGLDIQWSVEPAEAGIVTSGQGFDRATVYWTRGGIHTLRASACNRTAVFRVAVLPLAAPVVTHPAALCAGETAIVRTTQPYTNYSWRDANKNLLGTTDTMRLGPGQYLLEAYTLEGCPVKVSFGIARRETPYVTLSTNDPTSFCTPQEVTLQAVVPSSGGLSYEWFHNGLPVGANAPILVTQQFGQYTVQVTNSAGCSAVAGPLVIVRDCSGGGGGLPVPGGMPPCTPGQVTIQVLPTDRCDSLGFRASGSDYLPGSAQWTFFQWGKSGVASEAGDVVYRVFPEVGFHNAFLIARTISTGQTCFLRESFPVEAVAYFSAPPACVGVPVVFREESSTLPSRSISAWSWNFGNPAAGTNNTSNLREPSHVYTSSGTYSVRLTITANSGCTATVSRIIEVHQPMEPLIHVPESGCAGRALQFEGNGENLTWNFGDPASGTFNTAQGSPVYHTFSPGNYTVTAVATDVFGCTAVAVRHISVAANTLTGNITPNKPAPLCEGSTLMLVAPAGGVTYVWNNGSQGNTLTVMQEGVYSVTLTDANGCIYAPPAVPVRFVPGPDARIKAAITNEIGQTVGLVYPSHSICAGEDVYLVVQGRGNLSFTWSTGVVGTRIEFSEQRNNLLPIGTHVFTVTITDLTTGCTTVSPPFVVNVRPVPSDFFISNLTLPPCAGNQNLLQYFGPTPPNWRFVWNTGQTAVPLITQQPGRYFLRVINEFGCEARSNSEIILPGPPVSAIPAGCYTRCRPDTLCLPPIPNIASWQWFFNENPIPGANSPYLMPTQSGVYHAVLIDKTGCVSRSRPLTLNLYDSHGSVSGSVWADVNKNGTVDASDTLVSNMLVHLRENTNIVASSRTNAQGSFAFSQVAAGNYVAAIDSQALPPGWRVVVGEQNILLAGCDALVQINLLIQHACPGAFTTEIQLSACSGDSAFFNGVPIPAGSTTTFSYLTSQGCDSTVTVTVSEIPATSSVLNVSVCAGEFYEYGGVSIPAGGSRVFVLKNAAGCDSVVTVNVAERPVSFSVLNVSVCAGEFYEYGGVSIPAGGSRVFVLKNAAGCDSVVTVNVAERPVSFSVLNVSVCAGEFYEYGGVSIPAGGSRVFVLKNAAGCDSVVTVNVAERPVSFSVLNASVCAGEFYEYGGVSIPAGGSRVFVLKNAAGCDSVVTVNVAERPVSFSVLNASVCAGEFYEYGGVSIPAGGSRVFVLKNAAGCDSVVTVNVAERPVASTTIRVSVCPGQSFVYQGVALYSGSVQDFVLTSSQGCDSIVTVVVEARPVSTDTLEVKVCPGEVFNFNGMAMRPGDRRIFTFTNAAGCDSTIVVQVQAHPVATFNIQTQASCLTSATGRLTVSLPLGGQPPYQYSIDGKIFQNKPNFDSLSPGTYLVRLKDANGCVFVQSVQLSALPPLVVSLPKEALLPCDGRGMLLSPTVSGTLTGLTYQWSTGILAPEIRVYEPGTYTVEVSNLCERVRREIRVRWENEQPDFEFFYMPNVFAPESSDPENSQFKPYFIPEVRLSNYRFEIFDRWGNLLFRTQDWGEGWRGISRASDMQPAVFVWCLSVDVDYCGRIHRLFRKGDVTILR